MAEDPLGETAVGLQAPVVRIGRYDDLGLLGRGGMGEVRRVRDPQLRRDMAMKILRPEIARTPEEVRRFREEAQTTAQLQHPGIVPVHEFGVLADGRCYFTMKEVRGRTLREVVGELHAASPGSTWEATSEGRTFRHVIEAFRKACEAVAYAHARGVVHRDLKPDNVMLGPYGEVLVLDWGIARVESRPDAVSGVQISRLPDDPDLTRPGAVSGTPAYMAPEQARGETADARTDVYALGAILYEILTGRAPYQGPTALAIVVQVLAGPPEPPGDRARRMSREGIPREGPPLPPELVATCGRAMAHAWEGRPASAGELLTDVAAWLDGETRRAAGRALVAEARRLQPEVDASRARAAELQHESLARLGALPPWAPEAEKAPAWALADEAARLEREADLAALFVETRLQAALVQAPDLPEAHEALAERYRAEHATAEQAQDERAAVRAEALLRRHVEALPAASPARVGHARWLAGHGALTLVTDPPGATVDLYRYETVDRRSVPRFFGALGPTPLVAVELPAGSYLAILHAEGRRDVRYPVHLGRLEHWHGTAPGERAPRPVHLPRLGTLDRDDVYVPGGWFAAGGDPLAENGLPAARLWCESFVARRFPVTVREYLEFLNTLVDTGRAEEALRAAPRERATEHDADHLIVFGRDGAGHFRLRPDVDGDLWDLDWPIFLVDWFSASAYAAWHAERTGRPWRLPAELEREKAARGVDGRFYPWGNHADPTWASMADSAPGRRFPAPVEAFPIDCSPYGVRGMAGNSKDWCADAWNLAGPEIASGRVVPPERMASARADAARCVRGGSWRSQLKLLRSAERSSLIPQYRNVFIGLRLFRTYSGTDEGGGD